MSDTPKSSQMLSHCYSLKFIDYLLKAKTGPLAFGVGSLSRDQAHARAVRAQRPSH